MGGKIIFALVLLLAIAGGGLWYLQKKTAEQQPTKGSSGQADSEVAAAGTDSLPAGVTAEDLERAGRMYRGMYPGSQPDQMDLFSMAAEMAITEEDLTKGVACFRQIPTNHPKYGLPARLQEGTALVDLNRAAEAEASLREYLAEVRKQETIRTQDLIAAYKWLNYILSAELRLEERANVLVELHRIGLADILDSKQLFFPNLLILNSPAGRKKIEDFLAVDPQNLDLRIAQGRYLTFAGSFEEAVAHTADLFQQHPQDLRVAAVYLEALFEANELERFEEVGGKLPIADEADPWLLTRMRGELALLQQQNDEAVQLFQKVLQVDPTNAPAQMSLATAYGQAGKGTEQTQALERSSLLAKIRVNLNNIQNDAAAATLELVEMCKEIDFPLAAQYFESHAKQIAQAAQAGPQQPEIGESAR